MPHDSLQEYPIDTDYCSVGKRDPVRHARVSGYAQNVPVTDGGRIQAQAGDRDIQAEKEAEQPSAGEYVGFGKDSPAATTFGRADHPDGELSKRKWRLQHGYVRVNLADGYYDVTGEDRDTEKIQRYQDAEALIRRTDWSKKRRDRIFSRILREEIRAWSAHYGGLTGATIGAIGVEVARGLGTQDPEAIAESPIWDGLEETISSMDRDLAEYVEFGMRRYA